MSIKDVANTLSEAKVLPGLAREMKPRPMITRDCFAARVEATAARHPQHHSYLCFPISIADSSAARRRRSAR